MTRVLAKVERGSLFNNRPSCLRPSVVYVSTLEKPSSSNTQLLLLLFWNKQVTVIDCLNSITSFLTFEVIFQILMNAQDRHPTVISSPPVQTNVDPIPASVTVDMSEMALIAIINMPVSILKLCPIKGSF